MIYLKEYNKLVAGDLKFKYISNSVVAITLNESLYDVIDITLLTGRNKNKSLLLLQKIIDVCVYLNIPVNRNEIDRFVEGGYRNEDKTS